MGISPGEAARADRDRQNAALPPRSPSTPTLVPRHCWRRPFTTCAKLLAYLLIVSIPGTVLAILIASLSFFFLLVLPVLPVAAAMRTMAVGLTRWQNRWGLNTWPHVNMWKFRSLYSPSSSTRRPVETFIIRCWRLLSSADLWRTIVWGVLELTLCIAVATVLTVWLVAAFWGTLSIPIDSAYPGAIRLDFPAPFNELWFTTALGLLALITLYPMILGLFALLNAPFLILTHPFGAMRALEERATLAEQQFKQAAHQRDSAIASESRQLRELERNLHDGPQQSLVRTTLDIAMARRKLTQGDTAGALSLLDQASSHANHSLSELRLLVQGFGPAALQDHGLPLALEDLAASCAIPVRIAGNLAGKEVRFLPATEQGLYFVAAEALANAVKHAHASCAVIRIEADGTVPTQLSLAIEDNGSGGAVIIPGHGLAGLVQRMEALRGSLEVRSQPTGTTIEARVHITDPVS